MTCSSVDGSLWGRTYIRNARSSTSVGHVLAHVFCAIAKSYFAAAAQKESENVRPRQEPTFKLTVRVVVPRLISNFIGEPPASATGGQIDDQVECCRRSIMESEKEGGKISGCINRRLVVGRSR